MDIIPCLSHYINPIMPHSNGYYFTGMLCALLMILLLAGIGLAIAAGTGAISTK